MLSPGMFLGAVLLLMSARILPALEISLDAVLKDNYAVVSSRIVGFNSSELIRHLDSGRTVRLTWMFRLAGSDATVVRYAHRDPLGEGYIIFSLGDDASQSVSFTGGGSRLLEEFSTLENLDLSSLGIWEPENNLEGRLFLDLDLMVPPLSIRTLFGYKQDRSSWSLVNYPVMESE